MICAESPFDTARNSSRPQLLLLGVFTTVVALHAAPPSHATPRPATLPHVSSRHRRIMPWQACRVLYILWNISCHAMPCHVPHTSCMFCTLVVWRRIFQGGLRVGANGASASRASAVAGNGGVVNQRAAAAPAGVGGDPPLPPSWTQMVRRRGDSVGRLVGWLVGRKITKLHISYIYIYPC